MRVFGNSHSHALSFDTRSHSAIFVVWSSRQLVNDFHLGSTVKMLSIRKDRSENAHGSHDAVPLQLIIERTPANAELQSRVFFVATSGSQRHCDVLFLDSLQSHSRPHDGRAHWRFFASFCCSSNSFRNEF